MLSKHTQDIYEIILATNNDIRFRNENLLRKVKTCDDMSLSDRNELMRHIEELREQFTQVGYPAAAPLILENKMIDKLLEIAAK